MSEPPWIDRDLSGTTTMIDRTNMRTLLNTCLIFVTAYTAWSQTPTENVASDAISDSASAPATIQRADGTTTRPVLRGNVFESVALASNQVTTLQLPAALLTDKQPLTIEAEDGGTITQGKLSAKTVALKTIAAASGLTFQFQPGTTAGWYHVRVSQGEVTRTFEFWVGALPPRATAEPTPTDLN